MSRAIDGYRTTQSLSSHLGPLQSGRYHSFRQNILCPVRQLQSRPTLLWPFGIPECRAMIPYACHFGFMYEAQWFAGSSCVTYYSKADAWRGFEDLLNKQFEVGITNVSAPLNGDASVKVIFRDPPGCQIFLRRLLNTPPLRVKIRWCRNSLFEGEFCQDPYKQLV